MALHMSVASSLIDQSEEDLAVVTVGTALLWAPLCGSDADCIDWQMDAGMVPDASHCGWSCFACLGFLHSRIQQAPERKNSRSMIPWRKSVRSKILVQSALEQ